MDICRGSMEKYQHIIPYMSLISSQFCCCLFSLAFPINQNYLKKCVICIFSPFIAAASHSAPINALGWSLQLYQTPLFQLQPFNCNNLLKTKLCMAFVFISSLSPLNDSLLPVTSTMMEMYIPMGTLPCGNARGSAAAVSEALRAEMCQ